MPEIKLFPTSRVKPESVYLSEFRRDVTSQCGEDGLIEKICEILGVTDRWCVEFGAWDGKHHSNSWSLINDHGWNAVLIEGDPKKYSELVERYSGLDRVRAVNELVDYESGESALDSILSRTPVPADFEFLSIDVDGCDWYIWESLHDYRPRLVVVEFNPTIPNHVHFIQDRDRSVHQGASLRALMALAEAKGYELVATTPWNAFFVTRDEFGKFEIEDNSIDSMHTLDGMESSLFQLYDGTLVVAGCDQLLWHKVPIDSEALQVLPPDQRRYRG